MIKTIMVLTSSIIAFSMPLFAEGTDNTQTISAVSYTHLTLPTNREV